MSMCLYIYVFVQITANGIIITTTHYTIPIYVWLTPILLMMSRIALEWEAPEERMAVPEAEQLLMVSI